jgi:hypothetical protein
MNTVLLFETPWWLPTAIILVGTVLFYTANKRREMKLRTAGLAVAALGILLAVVSYFVDTDRERAVKQTRQLVASVEKKDWATMRNLLHPRASVSIANVPLTLYNDRDQIVACAQEGVDRYRVKSITVTSVEARQDQTLITVTLNALSVQDSTLGRPITSTWEFEWLESANGWALYKIRAIRIANQQSEQIEPMFPRRQQ